MFNKLFPKQNTIFTTLLVQCDRLLRYDQTTQHSVTVIQSGTSLSLCKAPLIMLLKVNFRAFEDRVVVAGMAVIFALKKELSPIVNWREVCLPSVGGFWFAMVEKDSQWYSFYELFMDRKLCRRILFEISLQVLKNVLYLSIHVKKTCEVCLTAQARLQSFRALSSCHHVVIVVCWFTVMKLLTYFFVRETDAYNYH